MVQFMTSMMLLISILCTAQALRISGRFSLHMKASSGSITPYNIRQVDGETEYLRRTSDFLSKNLYAEKIPEGQRKELRNLEFQDLSVRYGQTMGKKKFPSCLFLAIEDQEIIGCIGCDCQALNRTRKRFKSIKTNGSSSTSPFDDGAEEVACVMANLAVRRNRRGQGIAKQLIEAAENSVKGWGYEYLYLLVDSENVPAQNLYKKMGYSLVFKQEDATCVVSGPVSLKTQDCVNWCMRKSLKSSNIFNTFFAAFGKK